MVTDLKLPKVAEGGATGVIARVLVRPGDHVARDQAVVEVETEKAVVEVPSTVAGIVQEVWIQPGDEVAENQRLLTIAAEETPRDAETGTRQAEETDVPPPPATPTAGSPGPSVQLAGPASPPPVAEALRTRVEEGRVVPAAPSVRRFARELGIAIEAVPGTGPGGRISTDDVKAYARERLTSPAPGSLPAGIPLPDFAQWGPVHREGLNHVRRAMARHLSQTWPLLPQVTQHDEADVTDLEAWRREVSPRAEAAGARLTVTAVLLKVVATVLRRQPKFKASLDFERMELIHKDYTHIGVAVDTERGLLVPVVRDVDQKNILDLAIELQSLAERARQGKLLPEEMQGATFSISNLGGIGGTAFTPVVNGPEVAILGVARTRRLPRYVGDELQPRWILPLSLSYDHRVIDGAEAVRFLSMVVEYLEHPLLLALEG